MNKLLFFLDKQQFIWIYLFVVCIVIIVLFLRHIRKNKTQDDSKDKNKSGIHSLVFNVLETIIEAIADIFFFIK